MQRKRSAIAAQGKPKRSASAVQKRRKRSASASAPPAQRKSCGSAAPAQRKRCADAAQAPRKCSASAVQSHRKRNKFSLPQESVAQLRSDRKCNQLIRKNRLSFGAAERVRILEGAWGWAKLCALGCVRWLSFFNQFEWRNICASSASRTTDSRQKRTRWKNFLWSDGKNFWTRKWVRLADQFLGPKKKELQFCLGLVQIEFFLDHKIGPPGGPTFWSKNSCHRYQKTCRWRKFLARICCPILGAGAIVSAIKLFEKRQPLHASERARTLSTPRPPPKF